MDSKMKGFVIHFAWMSATNMLSDAEFGRMIRGVSEYVQTGSPPDMDDWSDGAKMAFAFIRPYADRDSAKYEARCETNRRIAKERRENREKRTNGNERNPNVTNGNERNPNVTNGNERNPNVSNINTNTNTNKNTNTNTNKNTNTNTNKNTNTNTNKNKETNIEEYIETSCTEQNKSAPVLADVDPVILNDGSEWRPDIDLYHEYQRLYPAVDVGAEFAKMRGWCLGNPKKRKTKSGVKRFVTSWLGRAQDEYHPAQAKSGSAYIDAIRDRVDIVDTWT